MNKNLLLGLALGAFALPGMGASPYQGSVAADRGNYYLYQVETGKWLQANMSQINNWTTHAELGSVGFDVELRKLDGFEGFQIFCFATNNGELNGSDQDRFYLDQGDRALCDWIFEPVTVDGVSNAYKIKIKAKPDARDRDRIETDRYIGANPNADFGGLSDNPEYFTWQLVSKADRIAWMEAELKAGRGPVDASWLIPAFDNGRNDNRHSRWTSSVNNSSGGGVTIDGKEGYPVQEYWHQVTMNKSYTITDLPTGTYKFTVQAYYRDGSINDADDRDGLTAVGRRANGVEQIRAFYYAGATRKPVKSIFDDAKSVSGDGFNFNCNDQNPGLALYVPNSMTDASFAMINGNYINEYIEVPVTDGKLTIGMEKPEAVFRDWLIEKRYYLEYSSTTAAAEDLSGLQSQLEALIEEAEGLPQTPTFAAVIANAETALEESTSSSALNEAISALQNAINVIRNSQGDINAFNATKELGFTDAEAQQQFDTAVTREDYARAIKTLRYARRVALAETHEDIFPGQEPAAGKFYLYNVGRKQFLQGGSDWGAHAALGMPGVELTFEDNGVSGAGHNRYKIKTGLYNGDGDYLNHRGYMDCVTDHNFAFLPVEGKTGVYYMVQGDYPRVFAMWDPYGSVDGGNADETNVCTETRDDNQGHNPAEGNPNAMWKLVTKEERDALMENATIDNPVDVSYYIKSPNVNQRERADQNDVWDKDGFEIWGDYGSNRNSFNLQIWNNTGEVSQLIEGLPEGIYEVSCQGLYRNGTHKYGDSIEGSEPLQGQANLPAISNAYLYGGNDYDNDVALPNILTESGKAPGEGVDYSNVDGTKTYHIPEFCDQIQNFVRYGLYKVSTQFVWSAADAAMPIGVYVSENGSEPGCWTVVDNFRLRYLGPKDQETDGIEKIEDAVKVADGPIYNLQGIRVRNASAPGIYIQNGKKFVVTK